MPGIDGLDLNELLASIMQPGGEKIAALLDSLGIQPPVAASGGKMGAGLGSLMPSENPATMAGINNPTLPQSAPDPAPRLQVPDMSVQGGPSPQPDAAGGDAGNVPGKEKNKFSTQDVASLVKAVAPTANHPIMSGGVTGGVKAPDPKVNLAANPVLGALMQAMQAGRGPEAPGTLGRYMR